MTALNSYVVLCHLIHVGHLRRNVHRIRSQDLRTDHGDLPLHLGVLPLL
jgi:hypothetical protein